MQVRTGCKARATNLARAPFPSRGDGRVSRSPSPASAFRKHGPLCTCRRLSRDGFFCSGCRQGTRQARFLHNMDPACLRTSSRGPTDLSRVALCVLVDREVADVHKLVGKARSWCPVKLGVTSNGVGPAGRQNIGCPVQPRGHVGAQEGVHPKVELPPVPKQRSCHVSLTRRDAPRLACRERGGGGSR